MTHAKKADNRTLLEKQNDVLYWYEQYANVTRACKKANVLRREFYRWMEAEEADFRTAFDASNKIALGALEDEVTRRAIEGTLKPVFHQGIKVGSIREYSDTLAIVLLKARAPEKYKERYAGELSGPNGKPIQTRTTIEKESIDYENLPDEVLEAIANAKQK